jgi:predicted MFS family arabinose efflux permease
MISQNEAAGSHLSRLVRTTLAPVWVRDFRLFFGGQMISTMGDMFYAVALPWLMLSSGRSPQELGLVLTAYGVPRIGTLLLGGMLSDRLRPRRVMLLADLVRALLVGALVVLAATGQTAVWPLSLISFPLGACTGLFIPASYTILPEILDEASLPAGNALNSSTYQLAVLVGSAIAGVVVSLLRPAAALAVDAATFAISAATLLVIHDQPPAQAVSPASDSATGEEPSHVTTFAPDITFGQLLGRWRLLHVGLVVMICLNLASGALFEVALPTLAHGPFAAGATGYGLLLAAFGLGALAGGLLGGGVGQSHRRGRIMCTLILVLSFCYPLVPFVGGLPGAMTVLAMAGIANGLLNVLFFIVIQHITPRHLLGRVMSILMLANFGVYPLSVALGGIVTTRFGPTVIFLAAGGFMALSSLFGWLEPEMRNLS